MRKVDYHLPDGRIVRVPQDIIDFVDNRLRSYRKLICVHDFQSKDSACETWACTKCGMQNPKWEWSHSGSACDGWQYGYHEHDPYGYSLFWYYRDWPKGKKEGK